MFWLDFKYNVYDNARIYWISHVWEERLVFQNTAVIVIVVGVDIVAGRAASVYELLKGGPS